MQQLTLRDGAALCGTPHLLALGSAVSF